MYRFRDRWLSLLLALILGLSPLQGIVAAGLEPSISMVAGLPSSMRVDAADAQESAAPQVYCQECELDACCDTSPCDGPLCDALLALPLRERLLAASRVLTVVILPLPTERAEWRRNALYRPPRG